MITTSVVILILAAAGLLIYVFSRSKAEESPEIETLESQPETESPVVAEEARVDEVQETLEEMEARLKSISNPDSDKPFAKMSVPEPAEVPSGIQELETLPEASLDKAEKKKRSYKKRAPKSKKAE